MDIRFLGHACFELTEGDTRVLIDPFLSGNPKAAVGPDDVDPTHIFLTHGHSDHYGDVVDIAKPKQRDDIDVALMCIGGHYTMDPVEGAGAAELGGAKQVTPCHYNTFPPIEQDAQKFKSDVEGRTSSEVVVLE